jgi:hypothetical protein
MYDISSERNDMRDISNARLLLRAMIAAAIFAVVGFGCGFFGPLYLLADAGVGPVTGFLAAPMGASLGVATAVYVSTTVQSDTQYARRLLAVLVAFATVILLVVLLQ